MRSSIITERKRVASVGPNDSRGRRLRRLILPGLFAIAAFAVLVSLGNWQIQRLAWKEDLIARVAERPSMAAVDLLDAAPRAVAANPESFLLTYEYRNAILSGVYDRTGEVRVFTLLSDPKGALSGPGYWVLTPLRTPRSNRPVYINRGFVPEDRTADYAEPPAGTVVVTGLIRAPETGSWFTPDPDLASNVFFARDLTRIAAATGVDAEAGFFIDLDATGTPASGLPQAGETRMAFTNNHLQYAVTWYGLAAALLAVFTAFAWRTFRGSDEKHA